MNGREHQMAVVVVSRWKGNPQDIRILREGAPNLKRHGAVSVRVGQCWVGTYAGQIFGAITFADWDVYGKAMQALLTDPESQRIYAEIAKVFELQERSVLLVEDL
jgi:hypothetical protein